MPIIIEKTYFGQASSAIQRLPCIAKIAFSLMAVIVSTFESSCPKINLSMPEASMKYEKLAKPTYVTWLHIDYNYSKMWSKIVIDLNNQLKAKKKRINKWKRKRPSSLMAVDVGAVNWPYTFSLTGEPMWVGLVAVEPPPLTVQPMSVGLLLLIHFHWQWNRYWWVWWLSMLMWLVDPTHFHWQWVLW